MGKKGPCSQWLKWLKLWLRPTAALVYDSSMSISVPLKHLNWCDWRNNQVKTMNPNPNCTGLMQTMNTYKYWSHTLESNLWHLLVMPYTVQWAGMGESSLWYPHRWERREPRRQAAQWSGQACVLYPSVPVKGNAKNQIEKRERKFDLTLWYYKRWSRRKWIWNSSLQHLVGLKKTSEHIPNFMNSSNFITPVIKQIEKSLNALNRIFKNTGCGNMSYKICILIYGFESVRITYEIAHLYSVIAVLYLFPRFMALGFGLMTNLFCSRWVAEYHKLIQCSLVTGGKFPKHFESHKEGPPQCNLLWTCKTSLGGTCPLTHWV